MGETRTPFDKEKWEPSGCLSEETPAEGESQEREGGCWGHSHTPKARSRRPGRGRTRSSVRRLPCPHSSAE